MFLRGKNCRFLQGTVTGMNALANGWVGSMDVVMVWAWIHWPMHG